MIAYAKYFDSKKIMSFKTSNSRMLKKYTTIWERVSSLMNIEVDSKPIYGHSDNPPKKMLEF